MNRYENILRHPLYRECLKKTENAEVGRIWCKHDEAHNRAVAKIMCAAEDESTITGDLELDRDLLCAVAFLHDIGRWEEYETGEKGIHCTASAELALEILPDCEYSEEEAMLIAGAILAHGEAFQPKNPITLQLAKRLILADHRSRDCFACAGYDTCHWPIEERNMCSFGRTKTQVIGILNCTPDSFSDGGAYGSPENLIAHGLQMVADGADWIDVGGESTRPGFTEVPVEEEIARVIPVIRGIKEKSNVKISLDTRKAAVARAGIEAGVDCINDVSGLTFDPEMAKVIAEGDVDVCIMHDVAPDEAGEITEELKRRVDLALAAGIDRRHIVLDPGVGFGKTTEENVQVIREIEKLRVLGYPLYLGVSRKSVIGNALQLPVDQRLEGTLAITAFAVMKGVEYIRVHDVLENRRVIDMLDAILG